MKTSFYSRTHYALLVAFALPVLPVVLGSCSNSTTFSQGTTSQAPLSPSSTQASSQAPVGNMSSPDATTHASSQASNKKPLLAQLPPLLAGKIQTAEVEVRELALPLYLKGKIEPDFNKEVDVTSHLSGRVKTVSVKPGDAVMPEQQLAIVESRDVSELEAEVVEAQSKVTMARAHEKREKVIYQEQVERPKSLIEAQTLFKDAGARRDLAQTEFQRAESLYKEKIAAGKDFYAAKAELAHAQAAYEQAQANLQREQHMFQNKALLLNDLQMAKAESQRAERHLDTLIQRLEFLGMTPASVKRTIATGKLSGELSIVAPVYGIITHQEIAAGEVVHPDRPMFTITDLSSVLVRADLPETHLSRVQIGTGVKIKVASYPDKSFSGKISFIAEHVVPETHMVPIRVRLENSKRQLKKDMSAEIDLDAQLAKVLVCPKKAVLERKGQAHVFVKNTRGNFEERSVVIGAETADLVEVCAGLKAGELVAIDNIERLRNELSH